METSDFASWSTGLLGQASAVVTFFMGICFVAGIVFVGLGLFRLKAAADTQGQQVKYGDGLWRLGIGAALIGLPVVVGLATGTLGLGDTDAASGKLNMTTWESN